MAKKLNKLVRDNVPEILDGKRLKYSVHVADDQEYWEKLKEKLKEEVDEYLAGENEAELADVLEVFEAIIRFKKINLQELNKVKLAKAKQKGGFGKRIILEKVG
ncbi:MAG: nucleoside triphosphate pyrophosphohydrolase [bacterium]|nr:nucleoside triphosphate pyrophosphohydrolase [bacterium]